MNDMICSIDIGIKNLMFCIFNNDKLLCNNKFKLDINLLDINFKKELYIKIKLIFNYIISQYNPELYLIEKQINKASNNMFIENIIIILCIENNKNFKFIHPNLKYIDIKKEFNIKKINKKQLINYITVDINKCLSFILDSNNNINKIDINIKKMDDYVDCILIYNYYKKYILNYFN